MLTSAAGTAGGLELPEALRRYFAERGWSPFPFQVDAWRAYLSGCSGLVHAPTGVGKTLGVLLGPVIEALRAGPGAPPPGADDGPVARRRARSAARARSAPLTVVWITPMRALAADTLASIAEPVERVGLGWSVEARTGDTGAAQRKQQRARLPTVLVTTPESLTLLLSYPEARAALSTVRLAVVDEWHELLSSKRGVQTELALARLRAFSPALRTWGLSATLANTGEAARVLVGPRAPEPVLVRGEAVKAIEVRTLRPPAIERFPWAGHIGLRMLPAVIEAVEAAGSTLVFTNTRSQAEIWFRALQLRRPDWIGSVALHHASLDREIRRRVEHMVKEGRLRCVVCTSSLDLGVDFAPVDQVVQVGSPKGIARLIQRAGRSGHRPGVASRVLAVPAHALELVEFSAARGAVAAGYVEAREPIERPFDVLVQHLVTVACGGGFEGPELLEELRSTHAYRSLTDEEFEWALAFVRGGGPALRAYPQYGRVVVEGGVHVPASARVARLHRLGIGTITADASITVRYLSGRSLGTVEEGFVARLAPGDRFIFAGRTLELVAVRAMTAFVRRTRKGSGLITRWGGSRMPLSTRLAEAVRARLDEARRGVIVDEDMAAVAPLLALQGAVSAIPAPEELLIEEWRARDGQHLFVYPFAGRLAHEGLSTLLAFRLARSMPRTVTASATDYGLELHLSAPVELDEAGWRVLLSPERIVEDLLEAINAAEIARRRFREIARIAGLLRASLPGRPAPTRQLQASGEMFFDVLSEFDPANRLLDQARREVLEQHVEVRRIADALTRAASAVLVQRRLAELSPFAFPVWAESLRPAYLSTEKWEDTVRRMAVRLDTGDGGASSWGEGTRERQGAGRRRGRASRGAGRA